MTYKDFNELPIWKSGYELLMSIYEISDNFPQDEKFALKSQIIGSANSIIANIAEAHGRYSFADKVRVLHISRGEICETRSHLMVANGRGYVSVDKFKILNDKYCQLSKDLNLYINSLRNANH